jgi:predicted  nucleic acid-binding Zn-ribbon protein
METAQQAAKLRAQIAFLKHEIAEAQSKIDEARDIMGNLVRERQQMINERLAAQEELVAILEAQNTVA